MIVWLASFPRSGNTLLRMMMRQAFGLQSFSMYDDRDDIGANAEIRRLSGHQFLPTSFEAFYGHHLQSPEITLVKTHNLPPDDGPAIYIIRDGRSTIVSFHNFLQRVRKYADSSISEIIRGHNVMFGDWSSHVRAWNPRHRRRTLLLRYPDLLANPDEALDQISNFIHYPRVATWRNNFDELHRMLPEFFNRGSDEQNVAQMTPEEQALFWSMHGPVMREFGFGDAPLPGTVPMAAGLPVTANQQSVRPRLESLRSLTHLFPQRIEVSDVVQTYIDTRSGQARAVVLLQGDVSMDVDLQQGKIISDEASAGRLLLELPQPTISSPRVDQQKTNIFQITSSGQWLPVAAANAAAGTTDQAFRDAQDAANRAARSPDTAAKAQSLAQQVLQSYCRDLGCSVEIHWR